MEITVPLDRETLLTMCPGYSYPPNRCPVPIVPTDFTLSITEEQLLESYQLKHYECCNHSLKFPRKNVRNCDFTDNTIVKLLQKSGDIDHQVLLPILENFCKIYPDFINVEKLRDIYEELSQPVVEWFQQHGYGVTPPRLVFTKAAESH